MQALRVVPVKVGQQTCAAKRFVGSEPRAEVAKPRAEIEHDRVVSGNVDRDARRISAATFDVIAVARGRTPNTMERDADPCSTPDEVPP